jgi:hypothetical protein
MATQRCFLYRRACDNMLMIHDHKQCRNYGTPDYQFYEFNDRNIREVMCKDREAGPERIPRHLGNFVRDYIERNAMKEHMTIIEHGDYVETDRLIRDALRSYAFMDPSERVKLHKKELNRLRSELRREQAWSIF